MQTLTSPAVLSRRDLLTRIGMGLGGIALNDLMARERRLLAGIGGALPGTHHAGQAKRVIYLFQSGGPSQLETFDYKPLLNERHGQQLPDSVRQGQRLTGMSGNQASLPLAGSIFKFAQHGRSGAWISELLPHTAKLADDLAIIRSMETDAINHDPAITFLQTGNQVSGRPSIGAWLTYGLGTDNENLPAFVVLITKGKGDQPLYSRLWGTGFLPSRYQGVQFRSGKDPVLYLNNPPGVDHSSRRNMLDRLRELFALARKHLDAVVLVRIVRGGDHHAGIEGAGSREERDRGRGHDARAGHRRPLAARAVGELRFDPAARFAGVAADQELRRLGAVGKRAHERRAEPADGRPIERRRARPAADAVGAEQPIVCHW